MMTLIKKLNVYWQNETQISEARAIFFEKGVTKRDFVSDDIAFAWLRCKYKNIDHKQLLPGLESGKRIPVKMQKLRRHDQIEFWAGLFNSQGEIQAYSGSNELCKLFSGFQPNELITGINGIGLAMEANEVSVIIGEQHYNDVLCHYITIGLPTSKGYYGLIYPLEQVGEDHLSSQLISRILQIFDSYEIANDNKILQQCYFFNENYTVFKQCASTYKKLIEKGNIIYMKSADPLTLDLVEALWRNAVSEAEENRALIHVGPEQSRFEQGQYELLKQECWDLIVWGMGWRSAEFQRQITNIIDSKLINSKAEKHSKTKNRRVFIIEINSQGFQPNENLLLTSLLLRIKPFTLEIPRLSEIGSEFNLYLSRELSNYILNKYQLDISISEASLKQLTAYNWGNGYLDFIRIAEALSEAGMNISNIGPELLPAYVLQYNQDYMNSLSLKHKEREWIQYVLKLTRYNIKQAAEILGITRATLYSKMETYSIETPKNEGKRPNSGQ